MSATAVLLLAAVLRLVWLHDVPPGLSQDEVLNADVANFIRQGRHALFFREGYGHEPLYHYWSAPFQVLFGDNMLSIRLPAVYLGLLLVAATMRWARREFGTVTAVVAGVGLAVSWWPIVFSRIGLRPILAPLLLVGTAWFWRRRPWLAGLFLGASVYSYTGARVVFAIPVGWGLWQLARQRTNEARLQGGKQAAVILLVSLSVALPLFLTLRADPTLQQRVDQLAGPLEALVAGDFGPILQTTVATMGIFSFTGDPRWTYTLPGRPLFDAVTAVFFYGGLALAAARSRQAEYSLALVWLAVGLIPSAVTPQAPSTVRLVGAMPVVYMLPGLAVAWLWQKWRGRERPLWVAYGLPAVLLVVLLGINLARTVQDGFIQWPAALETRLKYQTVLLDIGRHWWADPVANWVVADGFFEPIDADSLRRNVGEPILPRWVQTGAEVAGAVVIPAESENGRLYVPEFAPPDPALLAAAGIESQPIYRSERVPSFAVYALPLVPEFPLLPRPVTFVGDSGAITLMGYEILAMDGIRPLNVVTYWRMEAGMLPVDLAAFLHLVAADGGVVSQHDGFDAAPALLQPGDVVVQRHAVPLPPGAGEYQMQIGLYTRGNGRRLTFAQEMKDSLLLQTVIVDE